MADSASVQSGQPSEAMPKPAIATGKHRPTDRRLIAAPILLALCLAMLALSASAHAAGSSAMGWGDNAYGQTGNGAPSEGGCTCVPVPTAVPGLSDATQISGGEVHTLALHANGTVTAWGYNVYGQLGDGTSTERETPVPVSGLANVVAVDGGYEHSLALLADGTVMAWGDNLYGELGIGSSIGPEGCGGKEEDPCSRVPVRVPGLSNVIGIAAGYYFNLALLADGTVMAWGYDYYGTLGDGVGHQVGCECVDHPVAVPGISGAVAIAAGEYHGTALLGDGSVRFWGETTYGQAGDGTTIDAPPPDCRCVPPVTVAGLPGPVQAVAAGGLHNLALRGAGSPLAWGYNNNGQLGNGTEPADPCDCEPTPVAVAALTGVQSISAGEAHTLALLADGSVRGWGYNVHSQVGDGTEGTRVVPVPVSGVSGASGVSADSDTSFALIGPSRALTVALAGAGTGKVGGPGGVVCPAVNCAGRFPDSRAAILRAEAAPGTGFAGFTGACTGTGPCRVKMDADKEVTATFGPPRGTQITRARIKQGKRAKKRKKAAKASASRKQRRRAKLRARATFSFTAPGVVTRYQCMLVRPKPKGQKTRRKRKPRFSKCASPKRYKKLRKGRYTFRVRALNNLGADAKPAVRKFRIRR
jgi:alpha-tubulin suppressor-like RCC1 family protein